MDVEKRYELMRKNALCSFYKPQCIKDTKELEKHKNCEKQRPPTKNISFLLCDIIYTIGWLIDNLIKLVLLNSTTTTNFKRWNRSYTIMYNTRLENYCYGEIKYFIHIYHVYFKCFEPKS